LLERLTVITQYTVLIMALVMIAIGTVEAFLLGLRGLLVPAAAFWKGQGVWLRFARWLIAALTFQLAADVAETTARHGRRSAGWLRSPRSELFSISFLSAIFGRCRHPSGGASSSTPGVGCGWSCRLRG
jgi:uncharacterized membrane protein